ncbi:MAG: hypothetical protein U9R75_05715, partial [Candidatus Thermoplasmatota archaeon]|nr:hypothetical protein [Candidatus Thermoplasmatota archaeon]
NSRYGWYAYGAPGWGPSERLQYRMAQELYQQDNTRMGEHFALAKDFYTSNAQNYNSMRWIQMALNLMGDPEPFVRTAEPDIFNITLPQNLGRSYPNFNLTIKDINGTPIKGALVCLQQDDFYGYDNTDQHGKAYFNFNTTSYQPINVTVTAYNFIPFRSNISIDMKAPGISINSIENATTGEQCIINCTVQDEAGVDLVSVEYRPISMSENDTLTVASTENGIYYNAGIEIPWNRTEDILYRIRAMDQPGNWNISDWNVLKVTDNDEPVFIDDMTPEEMTTGEQIIFNITVTDNIEVSNVSLSYFWNGTNSHLTKGMVSETGTQWTSTFDVPVSSTGDLIYDITASDSSRNINSTLSGMVHITDNDRPIFLSDMSDIEGTTSDPLEFRIKVYDDLQVVDTFVEYWRDGDLDHINSDMTEENGEWTHTIMVPSSDLRSYRYVFNAVDPTGNWNLTSERSIMIRDNDAPYIINDWSPVNVTTGDATVFKVQVDDNIDVQAVWINISTIYPDPVPMKKGIKGNWSYLVDVPGKSIEGIKYSYHTVDIYNNTGRFTGFSASVIDNDPPIFRIPKFDDHVDAGSMLDIMETATDNIMMESMSIEWWIGGEDQTNICKMEKINGTTWAISVNVPIEKFGSLYFRFHAEDANENPSISDRFEVSIIEYVPEPVGDDDTKDPTPPLPGVDEDLDMMEDLWEFENGLDTLLDDSSRDPDKDGFSNLQEFKAGTDPWNGTDHPREKIHDDENDQQFILILFLSVLVVVATVLAFVALIIVHKREAVDPETEMVLDEENKQHTQDVRPGHHEEKKDRHKHHHVKHGSDNDIEHEIHHHDKHGSRHDGSSHPGKKKEHHDKHSSDHNTEHHVKRSRDLIE